MIDRRFCDVRFSSRLWLAVLIESATVARRLAQPLWHEADELTRIFVRSRQTARRRRTDPESFAMA